jgi:hypothetical protein
MLLGMVAKGDDIIELDGGQFLDVFGPLARYIHAHLGHHPNGIRIQSIGSYPSRIGFDLVGFQGFGPSLGHLTATGIACAKKKDFPFSALARRQN